MVKDKLRDYESKRDFDKTPEPGSGDERPEWAEDGLIYVIQKHDASTLHYDFRIEYDGVLKSWAVPKGPSTDPSVKRLAIPTEDHPIKYADFEGVIPEDEYGAGTVMVWDAGTYENRKKDEGTSVGEALEDGHITVNLHGDKLKGGYALTRTGSGADARWLLVKMRDDYADEGLDVVEAKPTSVLTGRTLDEIASDAENEKAE